MAVLPAGFSLPPLPYLVLLVVAVGAVVLGFRRSPPRITAPRVVALTPWVLFGSAAHVLYVVDALPAVLLPLAGTFSVYLTVTALAGATWLLADRLAPNRARLALAGGGTALLVPTVAVALLVGGARGSVAPFWPGVAVVLGVLVGAAAWWLLVRLRPTVAVTGQVGALALLGHAVDGVSTAVGIDVLGFGERTPLSRLVIEFAASLPTAETVGAGWLFVVVKLAVAAGVVALLEEYVREDPAEGYLLLGLVAAVGLGPGAHNLLLFAVTAG